MKLNLEIKPESKVQYGLYIYSSSLEALKEMSKETGASVQDLIRHSINNTLGEG